MGVPSTSATAFPGIPSSPQPAAMAAGTKKAQSARVVRRSLMIAGQGSGGRLKPISSRSRLALDREQDVRSLDDGGEALRRIVRDPDRELRLPRLVQRSGDLRADPLRAHRVELDRGHGEAALAERDGAGAGLPELDP